MFVWSIAIFHKTYFLTLVLNVDVFYKLSITVVSSFSLPLPSSSFLLTLSPLSPSSPRKELKMPQPTDSHSESLDLGNVFLGLQPSEIKQESAVAFCCLELQ